MGSLFKVGSLISYQDVTLNNTLVSIYTRVLFVTTTGGECGPEGASEVSAGRRGRARSVRWWWWWWERGECCGGGGGGECGLEGASKVSAVVPSKGKIWCVCVETNLKFTTTHARIPAVNYNELLVQDIIIIIGTKSLQPISNYQYYFLTLSYYLPINAFYPWIHKSWTRIVSLPKTVAFGIAFSHFSSLFIWTRRQLSRNVHNQSIPIYHGLMSIARIRVAV